ncbi:MAG: hypothetical protein ACOCSA_03030 [Candidatus Hadarchaeota archaeon]
MGWRDFFARRQGEPPFLIFFSFLISFSIARTYAVLLGPALRVGRVVFYLFYWGVVLIIVSGWLSIHYKGKILTRVNALLLGIGMGLFFDQIGFLLTHFEDYWVGVTYNVVIGVTLILLNLVYFPDFWRSVSSELYSFAERKNLHYGPLDLLGLVDVFSRFAENLPSVGRLTTLFTGALLILMGFLVLVYSDLVQYLLAMAFILNGVFYLLRSLYNFG